ncbi:MAG: DUF4347 domain-containing protein [Pirellulales bacterium]
MNRFRGLHSRSADYEVLEERLLFDAAPAAAAPTPLDPGAATAAEPPPPTGVANAATDLAQQPDTSLAREVIFVDKSVAGYEALVAELLQQSPAEVIFLDRQSDGVQQLAAAVSERRDLRAIHIISHGDEGRLFLGTAILTSDSLQHEHGASLAALRDSLSPEADILIYGCDFARGAAGGEAARLLADITGADVAASTDDTGHASLGGDWDLELQTGQVEATVLSAEQWMGLLAPLNIAVNSNPTVSGSGVGMTARYSNVGTVSGTSVDLVATVTSIASGDTVSFARNGDDARVVITTGADNNATVVIRWRLYQAGTTTPIAADVTFAATDLDGATGAYEMVTVSRDAIVSYEVNSPTNLSITASPFVVTAQGTQDESSGPTSLIRFGMNNATFWDVTYNVVNGTGLGGQTRWFEHDGNRSTTLTNPVVVNIPNIDLDANDSSGSSGSAYTATYTENGSGTPITDTDVTITNGSGTTLSSATIVLTNFQSGDLLAVQGTLPTGITASAYDPATGTITLSGTATLANYQTALRQIAFSSSSENPVTTARQINVKVSNGTMDSNTAVATINVNLAPDPVNDSFSGSEDATISGNVLTNDTDIGTTPSPANPLSIVSGPANGTLTTFNTSTGAFVYTPNANYNGSDSFIYRYTDGNGDFKNATVSLSLSPVNDAPVNTVPGAQTTTEDNNRLITGTTVADVDGGTLTTTLSIPSSAGTLSVVTGGGASINSNGTATVTIQGTVSQVNAALATITYTPISDYNTGSPSTPFNLTVSTTDGTATDSDTVAINVTPVADIVADSVTTAEDTAAHVQRSDRSGRRKSGQLRERGPCRDVGDAREQQDGVVHRANARRPGIPRRPTSTAMTRSPIP